MGLHIRVNKLLHQAEKGLSLDDALTWRRAVGFSPAAVAAAETKHGSSGLSNVVSISEEQIRRVHKIYGPPGLFRLFFLANSQNRSDFLHFYRIISEELDSPLSGRAALVGSLFSTLFPGVSDFFAENLQEGELKCDNEVLPPTNNLSHLSLNVLQPSLSRKFYNPGRHEGYLVYGLGGPRVLVSYPFYGATNETYDVYGNSVDVVTSLMMRGYHGSFLFLDKVPGLNSAVADIPGWLFWFAIVAAHSDLVIFLRDDELGFGPAQELEIKHTVSRVQKKVVELPHWELQWAKKHESLPVSHYIADGKLLSEEEFRDVERQHVAPLLNSYATLHAPQDGLFCMDESGGITTYSLDVALYA